MNVREIKSKTLLTASRIFDYTINPYVGCQHGCYYCYARFMRRFSGHDEPWGGFVDVKTNAAELLGVEIKKKKRAAVWVSGVCDPYQPLEARYRLTRKCLEILAVHGWPVVIQTRSSLVLRDLDVISNAKDFEVGLSVTTADDGIRRIFEPHAPAIQERIDALDEMHRAGVRTFAMIAPLLPGAESLVSLLAGKVDYVIVDRMNYNNANWIYKKHNMESKKDAVFFQAAGANIASHCSRLGIICQLVF